jgi:APA family basic amino acid/polyamine antiporter
MKATPPGAAAELVKSLGLLDSTTIVMGSMIGSGIFIVAADIARQVKSPGLLVLTWVISGVMTVIGAVSYGELAAMMPRAGGQYIYLREAFGPLFGFLYGWTLFLVIQTGTVAAVAVAFGKFLGVFFPSVSATNYFLSLGALRIAGYNIPLALSTQQLAAILSLLLLSGINIYGIRAGAWVQNIFTTLKVAALLGIVGLGLYWVLGHAAAANVAPQAPTSPPLTGYALIAAVGVALVGPLFSSDAWNNVTFTGAEIKNPRRNLPLALAVGTLTVCSLYVACNWVYVHVLPFYGDPHGATVLARGVQYAAEDRVATAVMQVMFGAHGEALMAAAIMISTFGCMNGMLLAGARVYYAMAKDGLFFRPVSRVHPRFHTPSTSIVVQAVWACLLTLSGTYSQLLDYVVFAVLLFYILTIAGIFRLRRTRPEWPRPYRALGYPLLPALYIVMAMVIEWVLLVHKTGRSLAGLVIVALGIPVYFLWRGRAQNLTPMSASEE